MLPYFISSTEFTSKFNRMTCTYAPVQCKYWPKAKVNVHIKYQNGERIRPTALKLLISWYFQAQQSIGESIYIYKMSFRSEDNGQIVELT